MSGGGQTILMITDNLSVGVVVARFLNKQGFGISTAPDTGSALAKFQAATPDIVVVDDLGGPEASLEPIRRLRQLPESSLVPVLMTVSTSWAGSVEAEAKRLGVAGFLFDPFSDMQGLLEKIVATLAAPRSTPPAPDAGGDPVAPSAHFVVNVPFNGPESSDEPTGAATRRRTAPSARPGAAQRPARFAPPSRPAQTAAVTPPAAPAAPTVAPPPDDPNLLWYRRRPLPGSGSVREISVAELLYCCHAEQVKGMLSLTRGEQVTAVYFDAGSPVHVESAGTGVTLAGYLASSGRLPEADAAAVDAELAGSEGQAVQVLLARGLISPHEIFDVLTEHARSLILEAFAWEDGNFSFNPDAGFGADVVPLKLELPRIILDGIKLHYTQQRLQKALPISDETILRVRRDGAVRPEKLKLSTFEARICQLASNAAKAGELAFQRGGGSQDVLRFLYAFYLMEVLVFEGGLGTGGLGKPAPKRENKRPSVTPLPSEPEADPEIVAELTKLADGDYFMVLGLGRDATTAQIHKAFRRKVKRYHADKLARFSVEVQKIGAVVYRKLVDGYQVLADPKLRAEYLAALEDPDVDSEASFVGRERAETPRDTPSAVDVAGREDVLARLNDGLVEAQEAIQAKRHDDALKVLEELREATSANARVLAWYGYALYLSNPRLKKREAEAQLRAARERDATQPEVYLLMARMSEKEGNVDKALECYDKVVELAPGNRDFAREARLFEMRARKGTIKKPPKKGKKPKKEKGGGKAEEPASNSEGSILDQDLGSIFKGLFGKKK